MKKLSLLALVLFTAAAFTACKKGPKEDAPTGLQITFAVSNIVESSATFTITPDDTATYYWNVMTAAEFEQHDFRSLKEEDMAYLYGLTGTKDIAQVIAGNIFSGKQTVTRHNFLSNTPYVVYGYEMDGSGNTGNRLSTATFTSGTLTVRQANVEIELGTPDMASCEITVTPPNMDVHYMWGYLTNGEYELWGGNIAGMRNYIEDNIFQGALRNNITELQYMQSQWQVGTLNRKLNYLMPQTQYWLFVVEISPIGEIMGLSIDTFTTTERRMVDISFDFDVDVRSKTYVWATVTPSDNDQKYYMDLFPRSEFDRARQQGSTVDGGDDATFMNNICGQYGSNMEKLVFTGEQDGPFVDIPPGTEYVLVAFAWDGAWMSDLFTTTFATAAVLPVDQFRVGVTFENIYSVRVEALLSSNEELIPFSAGYIEKSIADQYATDAEKAQKGFDDLLAAWQAVYPTLSRPQLIASRMARGNGLYAESRLDPDTEYYIWTGAFDLSTGKLLSPPVLEYFKTLPWTTKTDVTVVPHFTKYFHNKDVPNYSSYSDCPVILMESIDVSPATDHWYTTFFIGDQAGTPDHVLAFELFNTRSDGNYNLNWGKDGTKKAVRLRAYGTYTLASVGIGPDNVVDFGTLYREVVTYTPAGVSPASEFPSGGVSFYAPKMPSNYYEDSNVALPFDRVTPPSSMIEPANPVAVHVPVTVPVVSGLASVSGDFRAFRMGE